MSHYPHCEEEGSNTHTESITIMNDEEIDVDELIAKIAAGDYDVEAMSRSPAPAPVVPTAPKQAEPVYSPHKHDDNLPVTAGHHTADPFAPREGKTLVWRNVNMTLVRE